MTNKTMDEAFELITSLDKKKVSEFVEWWDESIDETEHPNYNYIYGTISKFEYTDFNEDEEEICSDSFFQKVILTYGSEIDDCYVKLAKIIDTTGF